MIKFFIKGFTSVDLQEMSLREVGLIYLSRLSLLSFIPLALLITSLICKYVVFNTEWERDNKLNKILK